MERPFPLHEPDMRLVAAVILLSLSLVSFSFGWIITESVLRCRTSCPAPACRCGCEACASPAAEAEAKPSP